jgi:hypothetical protein
MLNIDESARTAQIPWQYAPPGVYSYWGGSIGLLSNGDIEFDNTSSNGGTSSVMEVTPGSAPRVVWQMNTSDSNFYRAYRIPSLYPGVAW